MNVLIKSSSGITQIPIESKLMSERKVFVNGEINDELANNFLKQILYLNNEDSSTPISVYINSEGGKVNSGLLMYDMLALSEAKIKTFCTGKAYSISAVLFMCGDERYMLPNSELMLHQPFLNGQINGDAEAIQIISDRLLSINKKINQILEKHTGQSLKTIKKEIQTDHYFNPTEAINFGLCDGIADFKKIMEE